MQCECCLELCCADDMAVLSCHHIAHKACIAVLLSDPLYADRPCPVKDYCDGGKLLKPDETEDQALKRLIAKRALLLSRSVLDPSDNDIHTHAAKQAYEQLRQKLQPDEHVLCRRDGKLRYLKYSKDNGITTVTVYVDKVAQYTLSFNAPYTFIIPWVVILNGYTDFVVTNNYDLALAVVNGVINRINYNIPGKDDIRVVDFDNNFTITRRGSHYYSIIPENINFTFGYEVNPNVNSNVLKTIIDKAKQELMDSYYCQWLEYNGHEVKNLDSCIDTLKTRKLLAKKGIQLPPM